MAVTEPNRQAAVSQSILFAALCEGLGPCHLAAPSGEIIYLNRAMQELFAPDNAEPPSWLPAHVVQRSLHERGGVRTSVSLESGTTIRQFKAVHRRLGGDVLGEQPILTTYEETSREAGALAAIRRAKDRSDDLTRVVADWVWEANPDWCMTFITARDNSLLGRATEALIGTNLFDLGRFIPNPEHPKARVPQMRQRAAFHDGLFSAAHQDGSERLFLVSALPVFAESDGRFEGFRGSASDVTDRLAAEARAWSYRQQLEVTLTELQVRNQELSAALDAATIAAKAKSQFMAMMSHELRTPLHAVIGFSELMHNEAFGPLGHESYSGFAGDILHSGRHLLSLINAILDYVTLESGHCALNKEGIDVLEAVTRCRRLVSEQARRKSVDVAISIPTGIYVLADPKRLSQLLLNLLSNAVKFTGDGGRVEITVETGPMVAVHCRDTGVGIPADKLDLVFEPFRQIDGSLARSQEGTGLGLPIARLIAELHGGALAVTSELGVGTTFTAQIPRFVMEDGA